MSNTDGFDLTADEQHYFNTGGDVNDSLARTENVPLQPEQTPPADAQVRSQPQPQPEPQEDDDEPVTQRVGADGQPQRPRKISFAKYEEAENARRELERRFNERNVNYARLEERLNLLTQAMQPQEQTNQPAEDQEPDPNQDIFAYLKWQSKQVKTIQQTIEDYRQQIATGQSEMAEQARYIESMNEYAAQEPHFVQAYNFLLRNRAAELMAPYYPQATYEQLMQARIPPQIAQQLKLEERDLYKNAFERQLDPASEVFRMAQLRGFRPQPPQTPAQEAVDTVRRESAPQKPGTPMGQAPARQQAPQAQPRTATEMVDAIRRGQPAAQSLSHVSGTAPDVVSELTPERLADMSEEDFARVLNTLQARGDNTELRRLFGN